MDGDDITTYRLFHDLKFQEYTYHHLLIISFSFLQAYLETYDEDYPSHYTSHDAVD